MRKCQLGEGSRPGTQRCLASGQSDPVREKASKVGSILQRAHNFLKQMGQERSASLTTPGCRLMYTVEVCQGVKEKWL